MHEVCGKIDKFLSCRVNHIEISRFFFNPNLKQWKDLHSLFINLPNYLIRLKSACKTVLLDVEFNYCKIELFVRKSIQVNEQR